MSNPLPHEILRHDEESFDHYPHRIDRKGSVVLNTITSASSHVPSRLKVDRVTLEEAVILKPATTSEFV